MSKSGKLPSASRESIDSSDFSHDDLDFNVLKLDPELKKEIEDQGLTYHWMNAKIFINSGNFDAHGWRPYKRQNVKKDEGSLDFAYGKSPEGYIQRNDLILGVKTNKEHARYTAKVAERAARLSGNAKSKADELRNAARDSGTKIKVHDGYEENE